LKEAQVLAEAFFKHACSVLRDEFGWGSRFRQTIVSGRVRASPQGHPDRTEQLAGWKPAILQAGGLRYISAHI